ncbi:MAG: putative O-glycosylation ligase, exosortase A system-associated [Alphaproteobacteria bacterium]
MRNLLLVAILAVLAPVAIAMPHVGVLVWTWLSFMNPHREAYGFAKDLSLNYWFAIFTFVGWIFSRERKIAPHGPTTFVLLAFLGWTCLTTLNALDPQTAVPLWERTLKSFVLVFVTMTIMNTKTRIQAMLWVIAVSIGYYAVKGAGFTLITGGGARIYGPEDSMIEDNNALGLALVLILPLLSYLRASSNRRIVTLGVSAVLLATVITVLGTYSRGGLIALIVVAALIWFRSRGRLITAFAVAGLIFVVPYIVPSQWYARMSTIGAYSSDASFQGRTQAWQASVNMALDRPFGGGFHAIENTSVFARYSGSVQEQARAAHSIYFEVLGDHGFIGLFLYALIVVICFVNLHRAITIAKRHEELRWAADLGGMMQISVIGFLIGGSLLSMAYYDLFLVIVGLSANLLRLVRSVEFEALGGLEKPTGARPSTVRLPSVPNRALARYR